MRSAVQRIHRLFVLLFVVLVAGALAILAVLATMDPGAAKGEVATPYGFILCDEEPTTIVWACKNSAPYDEHTLPPGNWMLTVRDRFSTFTIDGSIPDVNSCWLHVGERFAVFNRKPKAVKCWSSDGKGYMQAVEHTPPQ